MNVLLERRKTTGRKQAKPGIAKGDVLTIDNRGFNAQRTAPITTSVAYPEQTPDSDISGFIRLGNDIPYPLSI